MRRHLYKQQEIYQKGLQKKQLLLRLFTPKKLKVFFFFYILGDFIDVDGDEAAHKNHKNYIIWDLHRPLEGDC